MNKQLLFVNRPSGFPQQDAWNLVETEVPELSEGEVLIRQHFVSLDPAMRGWMNANRSYVPPMELGEVMRAGTVGEVVKANGHISFRSAIWFQVGEVCNNILVPTGKDTTN